jgi:hypothetical protein
MKQTNLLGFTDFDQGEFLLHKERVDLAQEFVDEMKNHRMKKAFGVLISGPHGVGKSATGLLTFLVCAAKRLPCIYISSAIEWVGYANEGKAEDFLLDCFMRQNADLIVTNPVLRGVFDPFFLGDEELGSETMDRLQTELCSHPTLAVGIIVDEVQAITAAVLSGKNEAARPYFRDNWYNWQGLGETFVRMDIASSHGIFILLNCFTSALFDNHLDRTS